MDILSPDTSIEFARALSFLPPFGAGNPELKCSDSRRQVVDWKHSYRIINMRDFPVIAARKCYSVHTFNKAMDV